VTILGSATPSLEAVAAIRKGKFHSLRLPSRVGQRSLPEVTLIDMREEFRVTGCASILSRQMTEALRSLRSTGDQGILLLNRRGFATFLICRSCGKTSTCSSCSIAMTYHQSEDRLLCHYCSRSRKVPVSCPACGSPHLHLGGTGTERLEEAVRSLDPSLRVARMDRDTIRKAGHDRLLEAFLRRETDLLLGTQMLAKGHDFPGVTLVGDLSADSMLGLPDFRAAERTYQLLAQVAGRAGRGDRPGNVLIQAFEVDHPALVAAARHEPSCFYERELRIRKIAEYPPWVALTQILVQSRDSLRAMRGARSLAASLRRAVPEGVGILGPAPAPRLRLKGEYRYQILVKGKSRSQMAGALRQVLGASDRGHGGVRVRVETDPRSLL
jgi:primosomal protein N' (replication factor Y)